MSRRVLITGVSTLLGRPPGPGAGARPGQRGDHRRRARRSRPARSSARSTCASGPQHALLRRIVHAAEIDTVIDTRLVVDSTTTSPRVAHEMNVLGTMNILAACGGPDSPVTKVVFKSSAHYYGCERDDPSFFTEEMGRPHPPRHAPSSPTSSRPRTRCGLRRPQPRGHGDDAALLQRPRAGSPDRPHAAALAARGPGILGFDPRYQFIHEDDIVGVLQHAVVNDLPGVHNAAAGRRARTLRDREPARQAVRAAAAALGDVAGQPRHRAARPEGPGRGAPTAPLRPRSGQPQAQGLGLPLHAHDARSGAGVRGGAAPEATPRERRSAVSLRARSGGVPPLVASVRREESGS